MDPRQHRVPSQQSSSFHAGQGSSSNGGRRTLRDNGVPSLPYWQNKTPALLKADDAESFIASKRSDRFKRGSMTGSVSGRASAAPRLAYNHRRDTSYHEDISRAATRSVSNYDWQRSGYEHASREPIAPLPVSSRLVVRPRQGDWIEVERRSGPTGAPQGPYHSSEDEEDFSDVDDDDEAEMTAAYGYRGGREYRQRIDIFSAEDYNAFGIVRLSATRARQIVKSDPPPDEFWDLSPHEKTLYLFYYSLWRCYMKNIKKFKITFNREFYKYQSQGMNEDSALVEICKVTQAEYNAKRNLINKQAYERTQRHLFSDDRATPDSRASDRPSFSDPRQDESDIASIDSSAKEPLKFTRPHSIISFGVGGRLLVLNPEKSISTIRIEDVKSHIRNQPDLRNIDAIEEFKGPLIVGVTPKHVPLLFVENQIKRITESDIYRQNPANSDANDVLLIWNLLKTLIYQYGKVTGPELARLLTSGSYSYSSVPAKPVRGRSDKDYIASLNAEGANNSRSNSPYIAGQNDQRRVDPKAMDKFTQFLLIGYVDEAIDCAIKDGMLFDAIILAYRMFGHDRLKLDQIEAKMLAYRDPQHPTLTLLSVASNMPVPILANMSSTDDASSWRAHIAIVLANLDTPTALSTVHQLGLALARKDFHSAADFCFLAVNLLKKHEYEHYDCFIPVEEEPVDGAEKPPRQHITLINASLPDDDYTSTTTPYGWSITDLQATEIYDYARKMSSDQVVVQGPSNQVEYQRCRLDYAKMLSEYGGAESAAYKYCTSIASAIWGNLDQFPASMLNQLCDLADRLQYVAAATTDESQWVPMLRDLIAGGAGLHEIPAEISEIKKPEVVNGAQASQSGDSIGLGTSIDRELNFPQAGIPGFATSTPVPSILPSDVVDAPAPAPQQEHHAVPPQVPQAVYQEHQQQQQHQQQSAFPIEVAQSYYPQNSNHEQPTSTQTVDHSRHTTASPAPSIISNATIAAYEYGDNTAHTVTRQPSIDIGSIQIDSRRESVSIATPSPPPNHQQQQAQQALQSQQLQQQYHQQQAHQQQQQQASHQQPQQQQQPAAIHVPATNTYPRQRTLSQSSNGTSLGSPSHTSNYAPSGPTIFEYPPQPPTQPQQPSVVQQPPAPKPAPAPEPVPQQYQQQQQHQPQIPQQQQQQPPAPAPAPVAPVQQQSAPAPAQQQQQQPSKQQQSGKGGGLFSGLKNKFVKMIPNGANEMKLPDDGKPSIWWDENQQRWVGEGIEEPAAPPPPPPMVPQAPEAAAPGAAPTAAPPAIGRASFRRGAASRYANPFANAVAPSSGNAPSLAPEGLGMPSMGAAAPPLPPTFGFIPAPMPDDDGSEAVDPFSSGVPSTDQPAQ
uniref:Protein transport protein sec16 n=1 Tax=Panagrellus redivivus TaxID=6233 RepID=A0A7E4URD7_PANRE